MATRGAFAPLLAPGLYDIIYEDLEMHPEEYSQIFTVLPSQRAYEEEQLIAGLGSVPKKFENQAMAYDDPVLGGSIRTVHDEYALGFHISRPLWDDDQYGIMKKVAQDFGPSIRQTVESAAANIFNNAFSSTGTLTVDGVSLCNTAHPLLADERSAGGSYSNRSAADAALSETVLQELILLFEKMVNERGLLKQAIPRTLLVPADLQFAASKIMDSPYEPTTGNNAVNTMQNRLTVILNHYLTSKTMFFLLADKRERTNRFWWRTKPELDSQDDFNTKGAAFSVYMRFSTNVAYWHGIAGSNGV
jgi:phage major head subunit gpT-like protein